MNILIFIPQVNQVQGGTTQYITALLTLLANDNSNNKYYVLHNNGNEQVLRIVKSASNFFLISGRAGSESGFQKMRRHASKIFNKIFLKTGLVKTVKGYSYLNTLCKRYKIDIVHCPEQFSSLITKTKIICTQHDVQELHYPEFFTPRQRMGRAIDLVEKAEGADLFVVSYNHVKADLVKYFSIPEERIVVCLLNMSALWFTKPGLAEQKEISTFPTPENFLLYPANTWEHKNHLRLLQAVAYLRDEKNIRINIICSGHTNQHFEKVISPALNELRLEDQVQFLGIVDEPTLYSLYKTCTGVVVPTTYEAGSFPLMESMLMGIPVICSNVTSLPETIGNHKYIFDPFDVKDMAQKMAELYTSEEFREENISNSKKHSTKLLRTGAEDILQEAYQRVMNSPVVN